jgi:hypothetical protein
MMQANTSSAKNQNSKAQGRLSARLQKMGVFAGILRVALAEDLLCGEDDESLAENSIFPN